MKFSCLLFNLELKGKSESTVGILADNWLFIDYIYKKFYNYVFLLEELY